MTEECPDCAAGREAIDVATATLADYARALCDPCLRSLVELRPAAERVEGPVGALTVRTALSSIATAAAAELERRERRADGEARYL